MCHIIAKKCKERGCIALKYEHSYKLVHLCEYLTLNTIEKDIDILVVGGNIKIYYEYTPYKFIEDEIEFINMVLSI